MRVTLSITLAALFCLGNLDAKCRRSFQEVDKRCVLCPHLGPKGDCISAKEAAKLEAAKKAAAAKKH